MRDTLEFIFSSFWVWLGTVILLEMVVNGFVAIARSMVRAVVTKVREESKSP